uniref:Si:ch211-103f14.3 n=1 Tax=Amphilophus citrinellus TaxID=61819 RepID=A0A3Q0RFF1_AMPCI
HALAQQSGNTWIILPLLSLIVTSSQLTMNKCGTEGRLPRSSDITVQCGTSAIGLAIEICPIIYSGYNETLLILNQMWDPFCRATLDESVTPPVARFNFSLNMTHACGSTFRTTSAPGTGIFLMYYYSCAYPLEYLINNTQISVPASTITVKDNNGTFISTLSMGLFSDANYTKPLVIPQWGIELRTNVYVEVKATNLTMQYNVLLDRCYASISPLLSNSSNFNLFVSCSKDQFTTMIENGASQRARFKFPAFRFIEQQKEPVSTYYLHCITRLCERSTCSTFKQCTKRRKRSTPDASDVGITKAYTIISPKIITKADNAESKEQLLVADKEDNSVVGLGVRKGG